MTRQLTPQSSLDNLKREAKRWLKALRANDPDARTRLERATPDAPVEPSLRHVQHALAREHGLAGWAALTASLTSDRGVDPVRWFIDNACPDHHVRGATAHIRALNTASRILARYPEVARANFCTAIVCGDLATVNRMLAERPQLANEKSGPKGWEPLLYLAFTRLSVPSSNDHAIAIAEALLDHGADPKVYFMAGDSRYTPFVGVCGEGEEDRPPHPHRDALARLFLDRGADHYDNQVVYNIHFHGRVLWSLELMYEYSLKLGRAADWDDPTWSMLAMGGYGDGARWHLWIAIDKNDVALAEWCLAHGASPNAPPARDSRLSKRSLHEEATRAGLTEIADLLVRYGATLSAAAPSDDDRFMTACFHLEVDRARALLAKHPEYLRRTDVIFEAAKRDRADVVTLLLGMGISPDVEDATLQRPLHVAAYANALDVAQLLIDRGAAIDPVASTYSNTPLGFAVYARHPRMIELLSRYSRDAWELTYVGNLERLREVLREEPQRAMAITASNHTPLMWLPPDDEARAIAIAKLLMSLGADASVRNQEGETAADRAEKLGMFELATLLRSPDRSS
jgi:ankyrin repeat protein